MPSAPRSLSRSESRVSQLNQLHASPTLRSSFRASIYSFCGIWSSYETSTYESPSPRRAFHTTPRLRASSRLRMGFAVSRSHPTRDPASLTTSASRHSYKLCSQAGFRHIHTPRAVRLSRSFHPRQQSERKRVCLRHSHSPITRGHRSHLSLHTEGSRPTPALSPQGWPRRSGHRFSRRGYPHQV